MKKKGNPEKDAYRQSKEWKDWRKHLLESWDGKCACCGCKTKRPQLHHMTPSEYKLLEPERFVFVCLACHSEISRLERIKDENRSKYDQEWVKCFGRFIKE